MLEYSDNILELVTNNPLFALFIIKDGKYIYANQKCADLLELSVDSILGSKVNSIIDYVANPEQRERLLDRFKVRQSTILPENRLTLQLVCPSGKKVWVELVIKNSVYRDEPVIHGVFIDITKQFENWDKLCISEKKYKDLANLLPQTVFEIDSNGHFTYANKHGLQISGYTQKDLDNGIDINQLIFPADEKRARNNMEKILNGIETSGTEYTIQKKNGTSFPARIYTSPIISDDKSIGLRGVAVDITEIKERENRLQKQKGRLQLLSSRLTNIQENDRIFIARQLHDIVGQKLSLAKFNLEKEFIDNPELNKGNLSNLSSLISEISDDIRHIISGLHPQTLKNYGLAQTINWYIEECCNSNSTKCNLFTKGEIPRLPENLELNIYRIFQEATHNIHKHAQATIVYVLLEFINNILTLSITDNGLGFDINSTAQNSRVQNFGINNMRERALMIGGTFNIESKIDWGTSVTCKVLINQEDGNGKNRNFSC